MNPSWPKRSGATYTSLNAPSFMPARRSLCSGKLRELLIMVAGIPLAARASTWSFIRAINGLTTRQTPSRHKAGSW